MDQKSIRIASEMKMPKEHPKMSQHVIRMAPKSDQVGAMLGSKTVTDPLKSEAKRRSTKMFARGSFFEPSWRHLGPV